MGNVCNYSDSVRGSPTGARSLTRAWCSLEPLMVRIGWAAGTWQVAAPGGPALFRDSNGLSKIAQRGSRLTGEIEIQGGYPQTPHS